MHGSMNVKLIFCYCSYIRSAQQIRGIFYLDISFNRWLRGITVPFFTFLSPVISYHECRRTSRLWIRHLCVWRSWWRRRKGVKRYHNSQCKHLLGSLFEHVPEICFNHRSIRISRVSAFRLKELNCMISANILFLLFHWKQQILTSVIKSNKTKKYFILYVTLFTCFSSDMSSQWAGALWTHTATHLKAMTA